MSRRHAAEKRQVLPDREVQRPGRYQVYECAHV